MKTCPTCREAMDRTKFNKNKSNPDGLQDRCRDCDNKRSRDYYRLNGPRQREQIYEASKRRRIRVRDHIVEYLQAHPCVDCGESRIVCLDFDHVRGVKEFNISHATTKLFGLKRLIKEIEKCDVRCANCHRIKTAAHDSRHWSHRL